MSQHWLLASLQTYTLYPVTLNLCSCYWITCGVSLLIYFRLNYSARNELNVPEVSAHFMNSLHNTSTSHLRICQHHLGPTYSLQHPQTWNSTTRSARHIMHNYNRHASVTTMLQHLDLPTLQQHRQHLKIIMLYRITHQLANIPTATYITPSTRNTQHYIPPYARTAHNVIKTCFFPRTIKIWNNIQSVITISTTIPQLRQSLQSTPTSCRREVTRSADAVWTPHAYQHHHLHIYLQPNSNTTLQNIKSYNNQTPTHQIVI